MKNLLRTFLLSASFALASGCGVDSAGGNLPKEDGSKGEVQPQMTGGACQYRSYVGAVTVEAVHGPPEPGGDVTATVEFEAAAPEATPAALRRFTQAVTVPRGRADALGLTVGKRFIASASYITGGTCAPGPYLGSSEEWR